MTARADGGGRGRGVALHGAASDGGPGCTSRGGSTSGAIAAAPDAPEAGGAAFESGSPGSTAGILPVSGRWPG